MRLISASRTTAPIEIEASPLLCNGDSMKQPEFHRRYEACADDVQFELIGGIVYMASPLPLAHSDYDDEIGFALGFYRRSTPGVHVLHNATTILGEESEPQPDLGLRILPEYSGQSRTTEGNYVAGPPELLVEIAHSTRALDMHAKRNDYQRAGVLEYLVLCVEERQLHWFHFPSGSAIQPDRQGIARSRVFPSLWIHVEALLERDSPQLLATVQQGLASRPHGAFVKKLERARRSRS